jgi:hypothetical protein
VNQLDIPAVETPAAITRAAQVRDERAADHAQALEELHAARARVQTAVVEDQAAYIASRDHGGGDPGDEHERAARDEVAQAERRERGEALRLARAEDELAAAVADNVDGWVDKLGRLWEKADREVLAAVQKLEQAEAKRSQVRQVSGWLASIQETGDLGEKQRRVDDRTALPNGRHANAFLRVPELLAALREHVQATSSALWLEDEPSRVEVRQQAERLAALRVHERPEVQAAAALVDAGSLTLGEAELVGEGADLADVQEEARLRRARERPAVSSWG